MTDLVRFAVNAGISCHQFQCTLRLVSEDLLLSGLIFTFLYAGSGIRNSSKKIVLCIRLSSVNFDLHPTPQTKI
jgi:hypothetical protein